MVPILMAKDLRLHLFLALFMGLCVLQQSSPKPNPYVKRVHLDSLRPSSVCAPPPTVLPFSRVQSTLKIASRYGPCFPVTNLTRIRNGTKLLRHDLARYNWIQSKVSLGTKDNHTKLPANSGADPPGDQEFVVTVGLGTPKQSFVVLFDTGSDLTWVQCEPCELVCYPQQGPRFSPSKSSTYKHYPCDSPVCANLQLEGSPSLCKSRKCMYNISYGDGSIAAGYFGYNVLRLGNDPISRFPFGCGIDQVGVYGQEAGLLGLGRGLFSLVPLTTNRYGGVFSYCLPTTSFPGFLTFGSDRGSRSASFTPLVPFTNFYMVSLLDISVGGHMLQINSSSGAGSSVILDSGTSFTVLPDPVYSSLKSAFSRRMRKYRRSRSSSDLFDTCYNFSGHKTIRYPAIAFHFEGGANLELDFSTMMYGDNVNQMCLAFNASSSMGIIGNWQQRKTEIIYDSAKSRVGFNRGACT